MPYHLRFPFYEPNFGWGKPPWVTLGTEFKNLIVLMDTRDGDGIEVSLNLKEEDLAIFESNRELLEVIMCLHHSIHLNLLASHLRFRGFELPQIPRRSNFILLNEMLEDYCFHQVYLQLQALRYNVVLGCHLDSQSHVSTAVSKRSLRRSDAILSNHHYNKTERRSLGH
ncbi:uncharacterized protein LOC103930899 isoform X2 [Pyrus x bretschneideri]|uniref:uncharacterized protein LOC103930899 isoform X2 n=1 Tax=Pyrus x bretschneideri TaxID=225117 RepID=UPI002030AA4C|nr:uncharacterized protein LOC103930899 isoform X2 [Pyrus x bretschneideri]